MKTILGQRPPRIESPLPPLPLGAPARAVSVLAALKAADRAPAAALPPIALTDFAAWLADDWTHVNSHIDNLDDALGREFARWHAGAEYGVRVAYGPHLAAITMLTVSDVPEWRKALNVAAADELALYNTKAEVA